MIISSHQQQKRRQSGRCSVQRQTRGVMFGLVMPAAAADLWNKMPGKPHGSMQRRSMVRTRRGLRAPRTRRRPWSASLLPKELPHSAPFDRLTHGYDAHPMHRLSDDNQAAAGIVNPGGHTSWCTNMSWSCAPGGTGA